MPFGPVRAKAARVAVNLNEETMTDSETAELWSPELFKVMERAKDPTTRFTSLAHLLDENALKRAYYRLRKAAAVGVDGVTVEEYGQRLDSNVQDLHLRLKTMRYRHQPIRRVHIPKEPGKTRPLGISATEDKIVQGALREILHAVYEPVFKPCSFGYRPGRGAHDALRNLDRGVFDIKVACILEADITSFFDSLDRKKLMEMLQERVVDTSLLRLIGKCLHVGILDGEECSTPEQGTAQGSILSPMLGNIYLHYVLDVWFEETVKERLQGKAHLVRYADDLVIVFERKDDASKVMKVLGKRMEKFGLTLHPEKTRLIPFERPKQWPVEGDQEPGSFDFLGFTHYWRKSRKGWWSMAVKTRKARFSRAVKAISEYCRRERHRPVAYQYAKLKLSLYGHYNYYGVNGNSDRLGKFHDQVKSIWRKWLGRRSQRGRMSWERFQELLEKYPLPVPLIKVNLWARIP